ncbi:hypothetical protein [Streptomyces prunicolor]|uniref:hypothetical protein n=1 Tax=Streptomyces prunicolor TaxID=67348 RepID=UPI0033D14C0C
MDARSSTPTEAEVEELIAGYFAEQLAEARDQADQAAPHLAAAEAAAEAFAGRRELPPPVGAMKAGWELATWAIARATRTASAAIDGKATREEYDRVKAERVAVMVWLDTHGYEVPEPYRS